MAIRNEVRIIGGLWKGRKLKLPANAAVRPSLGRVRETLFNWLADQVEDSDCLDLFAGSGALGFEALSRGAKSAVLVDNSRKAIQTLRRTAERLGATNCTIRQQSALGFLRQAAAQGTDDETDATGIVKQWDIVFLDPPFASGLLAASLDALRTHQSLRPGAKVYFELERRGAIALDDWTILKQRTVGDTRFGLLASS